MKKNKLISNDKKPVIINEEVKLYTPEETRKNIEFKKSLLNKFKDLSKLDELRIKSLVNYSLTISDLPDIAIKEINETINFYIKYDKN